MNNSIYLVKPNARFEESYCSYIQELGGEERYPFPLDFDHHDFNAMLLRINDFEQGVNLPNGYVASTTYWLVEGDELIGVSNLRHHLNDQLTIAGGHIGLGIRPKYRKQGLSIRLLQLTLEQANNKGINPVQVHCFKHNIASARMIQTCGGVLDSEIEQAGQLIQRYTITLN